MLCHPLFLRLDPDVGTGLDLVTLAAQWLEVAHHEEQVRVEAPGFDVIQGAALADPALPGTLPAEWLDVAKVPGEPLPAFGLVKWLMIATFRPRSLGDGLEFYPRHKAGWGLFPLWDQQKNDFFRRL